MIIVILKRDFQFLDRNPCLFLRRRTVGEEELVFVCMLADSTMHAPAALSRWVEELPRDRPIVAYYICGFQVSGRTVTELGQRGYNARALVGGITAWHAIGGTTVPLDTSTYEETS